MLPPEEAAAFFRIVHSLDGSALRLQDRYHLLGFAMRWPSGDRVASAIRVVCSESATFTGAVLACAVETTLFGSVGTRSAGPEAKERMLEVESRSKTAEERIIVPRRR
jgi:hypothetical protein